MCQTPEDCSVSELTSEAGAPAVEIEVTPAMIQAGVNVLWESGALDTPNLGADQEVVQRVFSTMYRLMKTPPVAPTI